jgi:hypothetical protein
MGSYGGLRAKEQFGHQSRINHAKVCCRTPSEVVLAGPIHGLLRVTAAILAAEN